MDKDQVDAQIAFSQMQRNESINEKIDALRPKWWSIISKYASFIFTLLVVQFFFPETIDQPVFYFILLMIFNVSIAQYYADKQLHKRLDLLHSLIKETKV